MHNKPVSYKTYFSNNEKLKELALPVIQKLLVESEDYRRSMFHFLGRTIREPEAETGIHDSCITLLSQSFQAEINAAGTPVILDWVTADYEAAQKLGFELFQQKVKWDDLEMAQIARLGHSPVKAVRDGLRQWSLTHVARIQYELEPFLRLLGTPWDDIRTWAFAFLKKELRFNDWSLDSLFYTLDHPREDVQRFGTEVADVLFVEPHGLDLLRKLHEHPADHMRLFASKLLNRYASGNKELILSLQLYFRTVLMGVNKGREAKKQIFAFLKKEGVNDPDLAAFTVELMNYVLPLNTKGSRSQCMDLLLDIKETHPEIAVPIKVKTMIPG